MAMGSIFKLTGNGNNFLFVDLRNADVRRQIFTKCRTKSRAKVARKLCDPYQSLGADGLLFLENSRSASLKWDFYNADGSRAEMCGNAARCVGLYALLDPLNKRPKKRLDVRFSLETRAGVVNIYAENADNIEVEMPALRDFSHPEFVRVPGQGKIPFEYINTGVPHSVVQVNSLQEILKGRAKNVDKLEDIVESVLALKQFKKAGTNVTFYSMRSETKIDSLTFERGVRGFTQACGTGAVAAAYCHAVRQSEKQKYQKKNWTVNVRVPGGPLKVDFSGARPILKGPAKMIAAIELAANK